MTRDERFTFLIDRAERQLITALARQLRRTESDAVRYVVIEAARALEASTAVPIISTPKENDVDDVQ